MDSVTFALTAGHAIILNYDLQTETIAWYEQVHATDFAM